MFCFHSVCLKFSSGVLEKGAEFYEHFIVSIFLGVGPEEQCVPEADDDSPVGSGKK